ncbi:hypothetical protein C8Q76DRAFT_600446, partial [Earliella scabrosa]
EEWVDEVAMMDEYEREAFEREVRPVRMVIIKICKLAYKIVHSSTILAPAWVSLCKQHKLNERYIPRDVRTRRNSTYNMLSVAIKYEDVYNAFTANKD